MQSKVLNIIFVLAIIGYIGYYLYKLPKYDEGEKAPDFTAQLKDGKSFTLSDLEGNIVLLDFWGSWCGPCRQENPSLVKLYDKYRNLKGEDGERFQIVSVAVETRSTSWKKAIAKDNLYWPYHIYEEGRFKSPIVKQYGVKEIPTKYLIDSNRKVIYTNPSFDQIEAFLADRLK